MGLLRPRPYQLACLDRVKNENTLVNLPTGGGKTLVAVLAIDHFLAGDEKRVMFVVPTRVLVEQQSQYCRDNCQVTLRVAELSGTEMEGWTRQMWSDCLRNNNVLVGTAEVFRRALVDSGFISVSDFSLVILDECHNATGNSPMAAIMRDAVWPRIGAGAPRILGLTASFVNGSLKSLEQKRQQIETLLQAKVFCPEVPASHAAGGSAGSAASAGASGNRFRLVAFDNVTLPDAQKLVEDKLGRLIKVCEASFGIRMKELGKLITRTAYVLEELGMSAFCFALREGVVPQLQAHAAQLAALEPSGRLLRVSHHLPRLRAELKQTADELGSDGRLTTAPFISSKAKTLLQLLAQLFQHHSGSYRGIVFVDQIALTVPLAHLINEDSETQRRSVLAGAVSGVGSMTDSDRKLAMQRFRHGETNVLVCTNALEEGVDVSDCAFVVRFSRFDTTKSHIQGSGRARSADAEIYYFQNNPDIEEADARRLALVAKNDSLTLSVAERSKRRTDASKVVPGVYPYREGGSESEINFYNCLQIVYEFCGKTLGQSFDPEDLFTYETRQVCAYPPQSAKFISAVTYPSPQGMLRVTLEDANVHRGSLKLDDVLDPDRSKNLDPVDLEKRRMLFVVAIDMRRRGLLTSENQPSAEALNGTKAACPAFILKPGFRIRSSFARDALAQDKSSQGYPQAHAPHVPQSSQVRQLGEATMNSKGMLNEWAQAKWRKAVPELVLYATQISTQSSGSSSWVSTVTLLQEGLSFAGEPAQSKAAAEQSAASAALRALGVSP